MKVSDKPKHTIRDSEAFQKGRESLGNLITQDMKITGGTDVDWMIEHRGGFIFLENKSMHDNLITIPVGQMIAFERLHKILNESKKCFFLFTGTEEIDYKNSESSIWYFEMQKWHDGSIPHEKSMYGKAYLVKKENMKRITVGTFQEMIEMHWKEFEK